MMAFYSGFSGSKGSKRRSDSKQSGKPRDDALAIVQFMHPGKEQGMDAHQVWNPQPGNHGRKFMISNASYIDAGQRREDLVGFWCEYNPPTLVQRIPASSGIERRSRGNAPRYLHRPALYEPEPSSYARLHDTDPFVFGSVMLYCGCQQHVGYKRPDGATETIMRRLSRGSLILFGSAVEHRFTLDTVFVVSSYIDYTPGDPPRPLTGTFEQFNERLMPEYYTIMLKPQANRAWLRRSRTKPSFRLYFGATLDDPVEGMFSYVPCRPRSGFARPNVVLEPFITQVLTQGKKATRVKSVNSVVAAWNAIRDQIIAKQLGLAHQIELKPTWLRSEKSWTGATVSAHAGTRL